MNILKAIELNREMRHGLDMPLMIDYDQALTLGIEAMTYITLLRQTNPDLVPALFFGETKE